MKSRFLLGALALTTLSFAIGCGDRGFSDDGIPSKDKEAAASANALAMSVQGDFDKLSEAQKKQFVDLAGGNEAQAKKMCYMMAHPPIKGGSGLPGAGGVPTGPHPPSAPGQ